MDKLNHTVNRLTVSAYVRGGCIKRKVTKILSEKKGEGFVDTARASVRA